MSTPKPLILSAAAMYAKLVFSVAPTISAWTLVLILLSCCPPASAEVHTLTLRQALDFAAKQNPDVLLARLDAQRAEQGIRIAKDPFSPKVYGGSGLAWTSGYPNTIDGNAPSIFEAKTNMSLFNRPATYQVAEARENARGAQMDAQAKSDEVAYRTAIQYLDVLETAKQVEVLSQQVPSLTKVVDTMRARVEEGSELKVESKRADVNLASVRQRLEAATADLEYSEMLLAVTIGYSANDRVQAVEPEPLTATELKSEEECVDLALKQSRQLQRFQSTVLAKELEIRSQNAQRLPQVGLVAQYALFGQYNYQNYFSKFQANNGQLGVSITIPLLVGSAAKALADQAATDIAKLRLQMNDTRNQISMNTRRSYQQWKKAEGARAVAQMQLELAREDLSVLIAQMTEGRALLSRVEQARVAENERWIQLYTAEIQLQRARLAVLRDTGTLIAALRAEPQAQQP
ncbi:MAG: TolC family protein [Bryobacteraceae bacterium]